MKTTFSTMRTKNITDKVLMDLTKGFRFYSRFKCARKFKFCVSALVKRYPGQQDKCVCVCSG